MKPSAGTLPRLLSAGAVVLSLLFVGLEIRQNTRAQRAETRQALADASQAFVLTLAADADLARIWNGMWQDSFAPQGGPTQLTPLDSVRAYMTMTGQLRRLENIFLQSREGVVGQEVLGSYGFTGSTFRTETFRSFWNAAAPQFDSAYVRAFSVANGIN